MSKFKFVRVGIYDIISSQDAIMQFSISCLDLIYSWPQGYFSRQVVLIPFKQCVSLALAREGRSVDVIVCQCCFWLLNLKQSIGVFAKLNIL